MKSRLGKADSIFKKTKEPAPKDRPSLAVPRFVSRPPAGTSVENKLTVILPPGQVDFLDRLCLEIRLKTRSKMKRTEIIRALVAGLKGSALDLTAYSTEEAIADAIAKRLKG